MKNLSKYISQVKDLHSLNEYIQEQLSDVKTKWHPKEGLFTGDDPQEIANYLLKNSKDEAQAMQRLCFYMNRAGDKLTNKTVLNKVKQILKSSKVEEKLVINKNFKRVTADHTLDEIWNSKEYDKTSRVTTNLMETDANHWLPVKLWEWIVGNLSWKDKDAKSFLLRTLEKIVVDTYDNNFDVQGYMQCDEHTDKITNELVGKLAKYETTYAILHYYIGDDYSYIRYNRDNTPPADDFDLIIKRL